MLDFGNLPPEAKQFLKGILCPLCGSAVDVSSVGRSNWTGWNLRCVRDPHYYVSFEWDDMSQGIFGEKIEFEHDGTHYQVVREFENSVVPIFAHTLITGRPINGDGEITGDPIFTRILQKQDPFDFRSPIDPKEAAKRIQTILTFG